MEKAKTTNDAEKNIYKEMMDLAGRAYDAGYESGRKDAQKEVSVTVSCSWEKGVTDAWESICKMLEMMACDDEIGKEDKVVFRALKDTLENADELSYTRSYVAVRNIKGFEP